ncbi:IS1634 family transposase [Anaerobiospirillum sp. NML120449]|uniref:DUF4277 domain-containing protein n=1 Tax=Anaerobiospirillum sp. NML120449 TaxID=2932817 RepID=UPI001FF30D34|nr:IS1634 family transposase [Anaerobiospirillum sp. NML120449]MCK0527386.1 IS1634 family transposase [Anaerobiospirillum sp. NML120449]
MTTSSYTLLDDDSFAFKIDHLGLVAALMSEDDLISKVNLMIPEIGPHVKLTSGELFRIMVLRMTSNFMPGGLNSIQKWAGTVPSSLLGNVGEDENIVKATNRFAAGRMLDKISEYGPASFLIDFMATVTPAEEVQQAHLDSTSIHCHMMPQDNTALEIADPELIRSMLPENEELPRGLLKGNQPVSIKHDYSRDDHPELAQIGILGVSARTSACGRPHLIFAAPVSGNENDISRFKSFAMDGELHSLKQKYPNLSLLVMDSAGATPETLSACKRLGINVITRMPDKCFKTELKQAADGLLAFDEFEVKDSNQTDGPAVTVKYAWLPNQEFGKSEESSVGLKRIMFIAEANRSAKEKTVRARANKELKEISKKLEELWTTPGSCMNDAVRDFEEIQKKLRLCSICTPEFEEVFGYTHRGRPKNGEAKSVIGVRVKATACTDDEAIAKAIEKELYYVTATTETSMETTRESARILYQTYHGQSDIEEVWKSIKATGTFFDSFFFKSEKRMRALVVVMAIANFYAQRVLELIATVCIDNGRKISLDSEPDCQRPSWKQLLKFSDETSTVATFDAASMHYSRRYKDSIFYLAAKLLGQNALDYYESEALVRRAQYIYRTAVEWDRIRQNQVFIRA